MTRLVAAIAAVAGSLVLAVQAYVLSADDVANGIYKFGWKSVDKQLHTSITISKNFNPVSSSNHYIYWQSFNLVKDNKRKPQAKLVVSYQPQKDSFVRELIKFRMDLYTPLSDPPMIDVLSTYCNSEKSDQYNIMTCFLEIPASLSQHVSFHMARYNGRWVFKFSYSSLAMQSQTIDLAQTNIHEKLRYLDSEGEMWASSVVKETACDNLPVSNVKYKILLQDEENKAISEAARGYPDSLCYNRQSLVTEVHPKYTIVQRKSDI